MVVTGTGALHTDRINDDGSGFLYVGPNTEVELKTHLESCTQVYYGGQLSVANSGRFSIKRHLDVYGYFSVGSSVEMYYGESVGNFTMLASSTPKTLKFRNLTVLKSSGLILETDGSQTAWKIELDSDKNLEFRENSFFIASKLDAVSAKKFNFLAHSKIRLNQAFSFNASLSTEELYVDGTVALGIVHFASNLQKFVVGNSGNVRMTSSHLALKSFACSGSITFLNNIHMRTDAFLVFLLGSVFSANARVRTKSGSGGGLIKILSTKCEIEGIIQANGVDAEIGNHGDGGAGGSVLLDCQELSGRPILEVNGGQGDGKGRGGRGGRISVQYRTGSLTGEVGMHAHGGKTGGY